MSNSGLPPGHDLIAEMLRASTDVSSFVTWPVLDYSTWIVDRLVTLAEREPEPRVMNEVLRAWGTGEAW